MRKATVLAFALAALASGCSSKTADKSAGEVGGNLTTIAKAYFRAMETNRRPPSGPEDLKPFLPRDAAQDSLFRSARDGQPFVIVWGTDPRGGMDLKPLVIGYEKVGKDGDRMVFTAMGVMTMTDKSFAEANFPKGHKP